MFHKMKPKEIGTLKQVLGKIYNSFKKKFALDQVWINYSLLAKTGPVILFNLGG